MINLVSGILSIVLLCFLIALFIELSGTLIQAAVVGCYRLWTKHRDRAAEKDGVETLFYYTDIVQLRTGGPRMTVERAEDNDVLCSWFEGTTLRRKWFDEGALLLEDDDEVYGRTYLDLTLMENEEDEEESK